MCAAAATPSTTTSARRCATGRSATASRATGYLDAAELARLKDEATPHAAAAVQSRRAAGFAALDAADYAVRPPVVRSLAPVVAAARGDAPKRARASPASARRPRRICAGRRAAAPAPGYGAYAHPSLAPVIAPGYTTHIHFGGFGHHGWSDRRLKRDICRVGASPSGIPVYTFRYRWCDAWYVGAMAQDLLRLKPEAVSKARAYYQVDYGQIDVGFQRDRPARALPVPARA